MKLLVLFLNHIDDLSIDLVHEGTGICEYGNEPILEGIQVITLTEFFEIDGIFAVKFSLELALLLKKLVAYILSK